MERKKPAATWSHALKPPFGGVHLAGTAAEVGNVLPSIDASIGKVFSLDILKVCLVLPHMEPSGVTATVRRTRITPASPEWIIQPWWSFS